MHLKINQSIMIQIYKIARLTLLALILTIISCSNDKNEEDPKLDNTPTEISRTSLFNEVVEPEVSFIGSPEFEFESLELSDDIAFESVSDDSSGGRGNPNNVFEPGVLTAGEWNDLENWDYWKNLLGNAVYEEGVNKWNLKAINRYSFQVVDVNESFIANAEISLLVNGIEVWKTKTDNKGEATLWSSLEFDQLTAIVNIDNNQETITGVTEYTQGINRVYINDVVTNEKIIDIYFAIDATGSMGDEIDYLKEELNNVIESVKQKNPILDMRFGSVFYRDEGDEYVTRDLSFTNDETSLVSFISEQSANGGGDFPEAVHSALDVAITQNSWNENASSRILFLLLDAPPHYTQGVVSSLENSLLKAAESGIKIIPISASGIDKSTEYLMRSFAVLTNGTYVFITDDSGIGNSHIEPTVGDYEVQKLNELLINLIDEYIPE